MSVATVQWPKEISWVLKQLEPYKYREYRVTQMEEGEIRRPIGSPRTQYGATVILNDREWNALRSIRNSYVLARLPGDDAEVLLMFTVGEDGVQTPHPFRQTFSGGSGT